MTVLALLATVVLAPARAWAQPGDAALAARWAPIHYQDTDSSDYDADYLSTVDYDGDWNTLDNYPTGTGEVPAGGNDRSVGYRLVDVFAPGGLWERRYDAQTYASFGTFRGDNGQDNAANAPWGWDDHNDGGDLPRGLLATDPAKLVNAYFAGKGAFSLSYTRNGYAIP